MSGGWTRRVLLVDDDPMVTSLVGTLLSAEGFTVQSCADAATARRILGQFDPDLVILEVNLGGKPTGLQLGNVLASLHPEIALLYFTRYPTALITDPAMAEHVRGQVTLAKGDMHDSAVLLRAIDDAFRGKSAASAELTRADAAVGQLTTTQLEILALVAEGLTNAAIADTRDTSERAVEKQLKRIYDMLGLVANRDQNARVLAAMKYAQTLGWTDLPTGAVAPQHGLWSADSTQPQADRLEAALADWRGRCGDPLRERLAQLVAVGTSAQVDPHALADALDWFANPAAELNRGVELIIASTYTPPLAEAIEETLGADLDLWTTPVRGRATRTQAAKSVFLVGLGLGLVTEAWHAGGSTVDLRPAAPMIAQALQRRSRATRLPGIRADHLDAAPVCDTGDPDLDRVLLATLDCVGELGLDASTMDVISAATGVPVDEIAGRYGTIRAIFVEASDRMLSPAVRLNNAYQAELALAHSQAIAEACMLREFMRPERRRMRTITFEQLRLSIDDEVLQRAIADALRLRADELAAEAPGRSVDEVRVSITIENGVSTGLALVAQLRPEVWSLPFDTILEPLRLHV